MVNAKRKAHHGRRGGGRPEAKFLIMNIMFALIAACGAWLLATSGITLAFFVKTYAPALAGH